MTEAGYDGVRLAEVIGVKQSTVSAWATARSLPQADNLEKLSAVLRRPVAWFFEETNVSVSRADTSELQTVLRSLRDSATQLLRILDSQA